jgi:hypothetical protein
MSRMLTLNDAGWELVRSSAAHGRRTDALTRAKRLLARPDLSASVAAEAHRLAGELLTEAERYSEARRHLSAAAALEPACAFAFHLWGLAHERDPHGCDRRAAVRFRRASELEPENHLYRAEFGRAAVRSGAGKTGVRELRAAADAAPGDAAVICVVVEGLAPRADAGALPVSGESGTRGAVAARAVRGGAEGTTAIERAAGNHAARAGCRVRHGRRPRGSPVRPHRGGRRDREGRIGPAGRGVVPEAALPAALSPQRGPVRELGNSLHE